MSRNCKGVRVLCGAWAGAVGVELGRAEGGVLVNLSCGVFCFVRQGHVAELSDHALVDEILSEGVQSDGDAVPVTAE